MTLRTRLIKLEDRTDGSGLSPAEREAAIARYAETFSQSAGAFPNAMRPDAYRAAIERTRNLGQQRVIACMLPGDDDL
ncbi:hypothetical protein ACQKJZ_08830 [Sphingomonas sp. NPDC019816]|uniref:hypothetical protein n=1 Tax=Sphingomonas sp. NPDC019816 TaxID=3390679 RepID=UPI003CFC38BD